MSDQVRVLIADDDKNIRDIYRFRLENEGFEVFEAIDGPQARLKATQHEPDVVLLDYHMPPGDEGGLSALTQLRRQGFNKPIIMVTGAEAQRVAIQSFREGIKDRAFFDFMQKPVDLDVLALKVKLAYLNTNAAARDVRIVDEMVTLYTSLAELRAAATFPEGTDPHLLDRIDNVLKRFATVVRP